jgi:hypothetical protein
MTDQEIMNDMTLLLTAKEKLDAVSTGSDYLNHGKYRAAVDALQALIDDYDKAAPPVDLSA